MLKLPMLFCDGLVLQRRRPIALWGSAEPAAAVHAQLVKNGAAVASADGIAGEDGSWMLRLPPMEADRGLCLQVQSGSDTVTVQDVLIGEVWIAGGQSNMEYVMQFDAEKELALSQPENPDIRFFDYPQVSFEEALEEYDFSEMGFWRRCRREELPWFSAVGYYFAVQLQKSLGVPVGILGCNWGGTRACSWMDEKYLLGTPGEIWLEDHRKGLEGLDLEQHSREYRSNPANIPNHPTQDPFGMLDPGWSREKQLEAMQIMNSFPPAPIGPDHPWRPCGLYHTMLKKVAPYTAAGVIWYQGESDETHPEIYDTVLSSLMRNWRDLWEQELPFLIVQLAPFGAWLNSTGDTYPTLRQRQQDVCDRDPLAFLCSISDSGMEWDIHPKHKRPVGERLALLARGHIYGQDILCDAPRLREVTLTDRHAVLHFDHAQGLHRSSDCQPIPALTVNGRSCAGSIENDALILPLDESEEWTIEYARTPYYEADVYNDAGIPLLPFSVTARR